MKIETVKKITSYVAGYGSTVIAGNAIANNVNFGALKTHQRVSAALAGFFIGGAVSDATRATTDRQIDEAIAILEKLKIIKRS